MKLFTAGPSPFGRKVKVVLLETGQMDRVEVVDAASTPIKANPDLAAQNPLAKLPALVRDGGATLYDSRVITEYLDDLAGGQLYPAAPRKWETLTLLATADGIMDAAVLMVYEARCRPEDKQDDTWVQGQWSKVARALDALEARWMSHLAGPLDIGQIATGCALEYLDFRHPTRDWRVSRPDLAAWQAEFAKRPSMQSTTPS
ncbi:MAG: glutathione S-transferase family protein [Pseudomonadota bacterium]